MAVLVTRQHAEYQGKPRLRNRGVLLGANRIPIRDGALDDQEKDGEIYIFVPRK
jgi:hypothetical protein